MLQQLPNELVLEILSYLPGRDLARVSQVSQAMRGAVVGNFSHQIKTTAFHARFRILQNKMAINEGQPLFKKVKTYSKKQPEQQVFNVARFDETEELQRQLQGLIQEVVEYSADPSTPGPAKNSLEPLLQQMLNFPY